MMRHAPDAPRSCRGADEGHTDRATSDVVAHPLGVEVRYYVDDLLVRSQVFKETAALECHVHDARDASKRSDGRPARLAALLVA